MKKTSIFNLGGNACYIDEDAAEVLKNYLDSLRKHFGGKCLDQRSNERYRNAFMGNIQ